MNISWTDGLGSSLRCCWQWIPFILSHSYQCHDTSPPLEMSMWSDLRIRRCFLKRETKKSKTGRGRVIVLPLSAETYFIEYMFQTARAVAVILKGWRGVSSATLTVQTPGGLLQSLHWLSLDQREYPADRQGSPPQAPCRAAAVETSVTSIITSVRGHILLGPLGTTLLCHLS